MKNLRPIPDIQKLQPIIVAALAFDWASVPLGKTQPNAKWHQPLQSQCFPKRYTHVSRRMLKGMERPVDRILKNKNVAYQHTRNKYNKNDKEDNVQSI